MLHAIDVELDWKINRLDNDQESLPNSPSVSIDPAENDAAPNPDLDVVIYEDRERSPSTSGRSDDSCMVPDSSAATVNRDAVWSLALNQQVSWNFED